MKKIFSFIFVALFSVSMLADKQPNNLTSSASPIYPTETVTLTYDATEAFTGWTPSLYIYAELVTVDGEQYKDYTTGWNELEGDAMYAALPDKVKMTRGEGDSRIYTISMNIKAFFDVADEDLEAIDRLKVVVRAPYNGDNNQTVDIFIPVAYNYYLQNGWDGGSWSWKKMTKDGSNYKLEEVVFGGGGVDYNKVAASDGKTYVEVKDFEGDEIGILDTVTLVLSPATGTITAELLRKRIPMIKLWGGNGDAAWTDDEDFEYSLDKKTATRTKNFAYSGDEYYYRFKVKRDGVAFGKDNGGSDFGLNSTITSVSGIGDGDNAISLQINKDGVYEFTYTYATNTLSVKYPKETSLDETNANAKATKRMLNGQLVIEKNGKFYNALGAEVK